MPRKPRLDAPGVLHHVMGRGIEKIKIFQNDPDRNDFLIRLASQCQKTGLIVYAWALMSNHFHLLLRTGTQPLSVVMKKMLTGYGVNFNRRHKRRGHLFQNRYKSIVCEEDPYLLELTRYIHLNPLRAGIVDSLKKLNNYPWTGHSAIMGKVKRDWQDTETILHYFGKRRKEAILKYEEYVKEGVDQGRRPDLVGGGLIRSFGGWSEVISLRRKGIKVASDDRILGRGEFVAGIIAEAEEREKETLRLRRKVIDLKELAKEIEGGEGIKGEELRGGGKKREVVKGRKIFCQVTVKKLGYSGAVIARFLGVTTSAVNRLANSEELSETEKYIKLF